MVDDKRDWYLHRDCSDVGPLTAREVRAIASMGLVDGETPVKRRGMKDWLRAKQYKGLFGETLADDEEASAKPSDQDADAAVDSDSDAARTGGTTTIIRPIMPKTGSRNRDLVLVSALMLNSLLLVGAIGTIVYLVARPQPEPRVVEVVKEVLVQAPPPASTTPPVVASTQATKQSRPDPVGPSVQSGLGPAGPREIPAPAAGLASKPAEPQPAAVDSDDGTSEGTSEPASVSGTQDPSPAVQVADAVDTVPAVQTPPAEAEPQVADDEKLAKEETGSAPQQAPKQTPQQPQEATDPPAAAPEVEPPVMPEMPAIAVNPHVLPVDWELVQQNERELVDSFLTHERWHYRCFGLQRLERYKGAAVAERLQRAMQDPDNHVRCFALRAGLRLDIPVAVSKDEIDPYVLRTALRLGMTVEEKALSKAILNLRSHRHAEKQLLAMELQVASGDHNRRMVARQSLLTLTRKFRDDIALIVDPRLCRLTGLVNGPPQAPIQTYDPRHEALAARWRKHVHDKRKLNQEIFVDQNEAVAVRAAPLPLIATMSFSELEDVSSYLDELAKSHLQTAILLDATGSMAPVIRRAQQQVDRLITVLGHLTEQMEVGFVAFRDGNGALAEQHKLSNRIDDARQFLARVEAGGGAGFGGVINGMEPLLKWRWDRNAIREIVVMGDAPVPVHQHTMTTTFIDKLGKTGFITHFVATGGQLPWQSVEGAAKHHGGKSVVAPPDVELAKLVLGLSLEDNVRPCFEDFYDAFVNLCL